MKQALISVYDKTGLADFTRGLAGLGIKIISTGGTARFLQEAGITVTEVETLTGYPKMLGGRVKSLHPLIHGGILARRDNEEDARDMEKFNLPAIDMVVCNLYPFEQTVSRPGATPSEIIENIDIGGPTMVRAAAKNHQYVAIVVNPARYPEILEELKKNSGELSLATREKLATEAFGHTARYDALIYDYFLKKTEGFPNVLALALDKVTDLRYGENPHQKAALYRQVKPNIFDLSQARQLQGKELSFNNLLDLEAAVSLVLEFCARGASASGGELPGAVIVKHNNPCGVSVSKEILSAYKQALAGDPQAAFGGIVALNRPVEEKLGKTLSQTFLEVVAAPKFSAEALKMLASKKNLRLLELDFSRLDSLENNGFDLRPVTGGFLVQDADRLKIRPGEGKIVTKKKPSAAMIKDLFFAFSVAKHVKSNAIVVARGGRTLGIGAGQMSRVEAVEIAIRKAGKRARGAVLASDGFFPFPDSVKLAARAGIAAIIQPGGSVRDAEVIAEADKRKIAMIFTGVRHFKH